MSFIEDESPQQMLHDLGKELAAGSRRASQESSSGRKIPTTTPRDPSSMP